MVSTKINVYVRRSSHGTVVHFLIITIVLLQKSRKRVLAEKLQFLSEMV